MINICLFAGTTEGRKLSDFLSKQDIELTVCTATEYGGQLINPSERVKISDKRLTEKEIFDLLKTEHFDLVIDATHPYAVEVTENIREACAKTGTEYKRLERDSFVNGRDIRTVPDIPAAVNFLNSVKGNILLTTGSKDLQKFSGITNFFNRVYVRVLPMPGSLEACSAARVKPSHIIAMQGPFSEEMNIAMLRSVHAEWLVTKDSGETGGVEAKFAAARRENAGLIVIGRPVQSNGMTESEIIAMLCDRYDFVRKPKVTVLGIGPGDRSQITHAANHASVTADCLIGAKRMLDSFSGERKHVFEAISPEVIAEYIRTHYEYQHFCVLMSGDSGFFSGARRLLPLLADCDVEIIPGISSLSYFCAKLQKTYEDVLTVSLHGRDADISRAVHEHDQVFVLTGGENTVTSICQKLSDAGLDNVLLYIGERLSYPDEKITKGMPKDFLYGSFDPLSVILIENSNPERTVTHGLPDDCFIRSSGEKGPVPMTKSEIRSICLSKMALTENAVCWDIGSGTGSVSIEMALCAGKGIVYAVEKDPAALNLSKKNALRLKASNIHFIEGSAPEACADLPTPTHVFIGGASGKIREIIRILFARGTDIRIVATTVSLESAAELTDINKQFNFSDSEVVMVQTAKSKKAGNHHLMIGGNPVYIFTMHISGQK